MRGAEQRPNARARTLARMLGVAIVVVALAEVLAASRVHRPTITESDWDAVAADLDPALPVRLGTAWLGPPARARVPALAAPAVVGAPDLLGMSDLQVITLAGAPALDASLRDALEGRQPPSVTSVRVHGGLAIQHLHFSDARVVIDDLVDGYVRTGVHVRAERGVCSRERAAWAPAVRCQQESQPVGHVALRLEEVAYAPRWCLRVEPADSRTLLLDAPRFRWGSELHGHFGVPDFEARLRSEAPFVVTVRRGQDVLARWTVTDAEGWRAFSIPTEPGLGPLSVEILGGARSTWQQGRPDPRVPHALCLEARSSIDPTEWASQQAAEATSPTRTQSTSAPP